MESATLPTLALRKLQGIKQDMSQFHETTATVKVKAKVTEANPSGYVVINKADKTDKHEDYTGPDYVPPVEGQPEGSQPAQFSQTDLDAAVEAAVAKALAVRDEAAKAAATK